MNRATSAALLLFLMVLPAAAQRGSCLQASRIERFSTIKGNDRIVIATDSLGSRYRLTLRQACPGYEFELGAGLRSLSRARQACVAAGDEFIARNPALRSDRCSIGRIESYTDAMAAADMAAVNNR